MAVVPRKLKNRVVYYVNRRHQGADIWERVGFDEREAGRRDRQLAKELRAGTYSPKATARTSVGRFADAWFDKRTNTTADDERAFYENHVAARCEWFTKLAMDDVRVHHVLRLHAELGAEYVNHKGVRFTLAPKSVTLLITTLSTMFRDAIIAELISRNPFVLPRGTLDRTPVSERVPYTVDEARRLTTDPRVEEGARVWNALAFYTGMREGEVCGRRFRDWDRSPVPLGALRVHTQYNDEPIKGDAKQASKSTRKTIATRARTVPVHPNLETILDAWWTEGFELTYCRKPTVDDFIVPCMNRELGNHSRSSGYRLFHNACAAAGVTPHTVHATRHTFITTTRRRFRDTAVIDKITHNAKGDTIDAYTHWEWEPLCECVLAWMPVDGGPSNVLAKQEALPSRASAVVPEELAARVAELVRGLVNSGVGVNALAAELGVSGAAVSMVVSGRNMPGRKLTEAVALLADSPGVLSGVLSASRETLQNKLRCLDSNLGDPRQTKSILASGGHNPGAAALVKQGTSATVAANADATQDSDPIAAALADGVAKASAAGRWEVVGQLAAELAARRMAAAPANVVSLATRRPAAR